VNFTPTFIINWLIAALVFLGIAYVVLYGVTIRPL
jgi:hypothetical protein